MNDNTPNDEHPNAEVAKLAQELEAHLGVKTDEDRTWLLWQMYRDDCPAPYRPIIDAALRLPRGVRYVPNFHGAIRAKVGPTATDEWCTAALAWWNRLQYENIPSVPLDRRQVVLRQNALWFINLQILDDHRVAGRKMQQRNLFVPLVRQQIADATDNEIDAAYQWAKEFSALEPDDFLVIYGGDHAYYHTTILIYQWAEGMLERCKGCPEAPLDLIVTVSAANLTDFYQKMSADYHADVAAVQRDAASLAKARQAAMAKA